MREFSSKGTWMRQESFLFETYVVNGDDENVQNAIQKNGDVIIKFYDQYYSNFDYTYSNIIYDNFNGTFTTLRSFNTTNTTSFNSNDTLCFSSLGDLKETGRVEKGSKSDQTFNTDSTIFNSFPTKSDWWKIKPNSTKVMVREDLVVYCTECGSKRKKDSHKFCPHCGTKF